MAAHDIVMGAGGASAGDATYIEDVFSTYLYTGNGSTQTITNGIDLSTKGGMVWTKDRTTGGTDHRVFDTARGVGKNLITDGTYAQSTDVSSLTAFNTNGFSLGNDSMTNTNAANYASWTFRKQPKFFDVVTYTGNGTSVRNIAHNLGSVPGCVIVKVTSDINNWNLYHRGLNGGTNPQDYFVSLNTTNAQSANAIWNNTAPTSTQFTVNGGTSVNASGQTYVAYLFAHDAGGFGAAGTDNVISCGSYTTDSLGKATVNLGYEPQWLITKNITSTSNWVLQDIMRGLGGEPNPTNALLYANLANAEYLGQTGYYVTSTGFNLLNQEANKTFIYIAIRRPMKPPTTGTEVFKPVKQAGGGTVTTNFPIDCVINGFTSLTVDKLERSRLQGGFQQLATSSTAAETTEAGNFNFASNTGLVDNYFGSGNQVFYECFRRAPGFFDVVCYTGNGTYGNKNHNLGVVPELIISKKRSTTSPWYVWTPGSSAKYAVLNTTAAWANLGNSPATSTTFQATFNDETGDTCVAYLFASCPGVSKVGSYTGTGTTNQINCGFTGGARFVLIKRTDSTGDWYVWDTARGIVSGNDPYLLMNSTAAEVTSTDYIDPYSAGFEISSTAPAAINASGGSFIYLAIA